MAWAKNRLPEFHALTEILESTFLKPPIVLDELAFRRRKYIELLKVIHDENGGIMGESKAGENCSQVIRVLTDLSRRPRGSHRRA